MGVDEHLVIYLRSIGQPAGDLAPLEQERSQPFVALGVPVDGVRVALSAHEPDLGPTFNHPAMYYSCCFTLSACVLLVP